MFTSSQAYIKTIFEEEQEGEELSFTSSKPSLDFFCALKLWKNIVCVHINKVVERS